MNPIPNLFHLPPGRKPPSELHAVIEIPQGGRNKFEYDPATGLFRLDRVISSAVVYPAAYGFVPGTLADDGDPADVLVLTTEPAFTGCLVDARPVGLLHMRDEKGGDEKILAVPVRDPYYEGVRELSDVAPHVLRQMEHFFTIYKELEAHVVETFGWSDRVSAETYVTKAIAAWKRKQAAPAQAETAKARKPARPRT